MTRPFRPFIVLAVTLFALLGCGGGNQAGGVGEGGTGFAAGTVTGFGSLIVGGTEYSDAQASYQIDLDPRAAQPATTSDIALGMQVTLGLANGSIGTAIAAAEVVGPVDRIDAGASTIGILGQTVLVDTSPAAPTVLDGIARLADLQPGMHIEVHGQRASDGAILATRIALRPSNDPSIRIAGPIDHLDQANATFTIGAETVNYASAQLLPAGATLFDGQRAVVYTTALPLGTTIVAAAVRGDAIAPADAPDSRVDGIVTAFKSPADFTVAGLQVDASAAHFDGGGAADLHDGTVVRVHGAFVSGTLQAGKVTILAAAPSAGVQLTGPITGFVAANAAFRVRGVLVQLANNVRFLASSGRPAGSVANLANGVAVRIGGALVGGIVQAATVTFIDAGQEGFVPVVAGLISGYVPATMTLQVGDAQTPVVVVATTQFVGGTAADLANGRRVVITGSYGASSGQLVASRVAFLDNPASPETVHIEGIAAAVTATGFAVDNNPIVITAQTQFQVNDAAATATALVSGATVDVRATVSGATVTATLVNVLHASGGTRANVSGFVTGFVSSADFLVNGQRVDASRAQFQGGNVGALANGVYARIAGVLQGGVIVATTVTFDN